MAVTDDTARASAIGLEDLYQRYRRWLTCRVRRQGGGELTEDIVQEAYLRVARMPADQAVTHPKALLLTVARRLLVDDRRRAAREQAGMKMAADLSRLDVLVDDQLEAILLKETLLALPKVYRDVFVLHRFDGMSYEAIAKARGLTVKAVEWRVTKAMALCAAKLEE